MPIVPTWLGDDGAVVRAALRDGADGLVFVALGAGHVSPAVLAALREAAAAVPVALTCAPSAACSLHDTYGFEGAEGDLRASGALPGRRAVAAGRADGPAGRARQRLRARRPGERARRIERSAQTSRTAAMTRLTVERLSSAHGPARRCTCGRRRRIRARVKRDHAGHMANDGANTSRSEHPEEVTATPDLELKLPARAENVAVVRHAFGGFAEALTSTSRRSPTSSSR